MKNWKQNLIIFLVAFVVFVAIKVPAALVVNQLTLPENIKLGNVSGSLWQGRMDALQVERDVIRDISWDVNPWSLLTGKLGADVDFGNPRDKQQTSGKGYLAASITGSLSAEDFTLRYPAKGSMEKAGIMLPGDIDGRFIVNIDNFATGEPWCSDLVGKARWNDAIVNSFDVKLPIGSLAAELGCADGNVTAKVAEKNPLGLQLDATIAAKGKVTAKGFVKPGADMPTEVHEAVKILGRADQQGRYPVSL